MIAQREESAAAEILRKPCNIFIITRCITTKRKLRWRMAYCHLKMGNEPQMLEHLRRTIDLAVRYDYEYWLQREALAHAELFATEEAAELLPSDLRSHLADAGAGR